MKRKEKKIELFLDSGAFSAKSQGAAINIKEYIAFIKKHEDLISVYANLDVIGDAEGTWKNQRIMEKAGLKPMPVYHYGEDVKYLERYIEQHDYIGLGGMVIGGATAKLTQWLDRMFSDYICDPGGLPLVKVHGFGLTNLRHMYRYPWYSVDSTSWVKTGRMGSIYVPKSMNGDWVYDENSNKIAISSRSPGKKARGKHIDSIRKASLRDAVFDYIKEKGYVMGKSTFHIVDKNYKLKDGERINDKEPKDKQGNVRKGKKEIEKILEVGLCNRYQLRDELNIIYFQDLERSIPEWPWAFTASSIEQQTMF